MVCTKTLYNEVWGGNLSLNILELPEAIKRKKHHKSPVKRKKVYGTSIDERPEIVDSRTEEGHWEGDTVVGKRNGKESVILTLLEKENAELHCDSYSRKDQRGSEHRYGETP